MKAVSAKRRRLRNFIQLLSRRRRLILVTAGTVFLLTIVVCVLTPKRYTATSIIQVQKTSPIPGLTATLGAGVAMAPVVPDTGMRAESDRFWSESLALQVIEELNLQRSADLAPGAKSKGNSGGNSAAGPGKSPDIPPQLRDNLVAAFHDRLSVQEVPQTRLMTISYTSRDPYVAADVVNRLVKDLIAGPATSQAVSDPVSMRLQAQLNEYRKHSEGVQSRVVELQQNGGEAAAEKQPLNAPDSEKLQRSAAALSQATMNRILKQAAYDVARSGDPASIAQLSARMGGPALVPGAQAPSEFQAMLAQQAALKRQIDQDSARFGAAYPPLAREKASLRSLEQSLQEEMAEAGSRARTDYELAVQGEESARAAYEADRDDASKSNPQSAADPQIVQEAEQSKQIYQDLLQHLNQQGIAQGLPAATITVVDPATPPASPTEPSIPRYLLLGATGGLCLAAFAVLVAEVLDANRRQAPAFGRK